MLMLRQISNGNILSTIIRNGYGGVNLNRISSSNKTINIDNSFNVRSLSSSVNLKKDQVNDLKVEHDQKKQKFIIHLDPDHEAYLKYERMGNHEVLLHHTEVPKDFNGMGLGKVLAMEAFKHFNDTNQKMTITCQYLRKIEKTLGNTSNTK